MDCTLAAARAGYEDQGHRITGERALNRDRGIRWNLVHLAIDDHSRVSFVLIKADDRGRSCADFRSRPPNPFNVGSWRQCRFPSPPGGGRRAIRGVDVRHQSMRCLLSAARRSPALARVEESHWRPSTPWGCSTRR